VLAIAGVAAVAVVLFAVPLALVLQRAYRDEELLRLQRDTVAATRGIDLGAGPRDPVELPASRDRIAVYGADGRRVAGRGPARGDALVRAALRRQRPTSRSGAQRLAVAVPLVVDETVMGAVRAERDDAHATALARRRWWSMAAVALGVVALAMLAALVLGRHLARPLERLAGAARRLGDGDFTVRAPRAGVAEVDQVAAALDAAAERLDALVTRERAFTSDASHQLRTPLAALRIELEAMELRGAAPPELAAALAQVDRLQETITTLLAVARDTPDRMQLTPLRALLDEAEARWRGPLASEDRPLRVHVDGADMTAGISGAVVREIVDVLLDNARRHGAGAVSVHARQLGGSIALDVRDEGPGVTLPDDDLFARRAGTGDGAGIGLALARSLAQAEGGRLTLTRRTPAVFTLLMPSAPERDA
jgi:signal transduction histidine kinase